MSNINKDIQAIVSQVSIKIKFFYIKKKKIFRQMQK